MTREAARVEMSSQFLAANGILRLQEEQGTLLVTADRPLSDAALAALKFAAGLPVRVEIKERQIVAATDLISNAAGASANEGSLTSSLFAHFHKREAMVQSLATFAACLDAGYSPREAAHLMLGSAGGVEALDRDLQQFYFGLAAQDDFATVVNRSRAIPFWLRQAVAAVPDIETQTRIFAQSLPIASALQAQQRQDRTRNILYASVWLLAASAWALIALQAALIVAAAGIAFALWHRASAAAEGISNSLLLATLKIIVQAHQLKLPPAITIRIAGHFLIEHRAITDRAPEKRESLGVAMQLSPLRRALFAKGDLGAAADRLSKLLQRQTDASLRKAEQIVCLAGLLGFMPLLWVSALQ